MIAKNQIKVILQGDRIEHVDYILENKKDLDYKFYISNQIMKPVKQLLDVAIDSEETDKNYLICLLNNYLIIINSSSTISFLSSINFNSFFIKYKII